MGRWYRLSLLRWRRSTRSRKNCSGQTSLKHNKITLNAPLSSLFSPISSLTTRYSEIRRGRARERASGVNFLVPEKEGEDGPEEVERRVEEFGDGRRRQKGRKECLRRERKRGATERERERRTNSLLAPLLATENFRRERREESAGEWRGRERDRERWEIERGWICEIFSRRKIFRREKGIAHARGREGERLWERKKKERKRRKRKKEARKKEERGKERRGRRNLPLFLLRTRACGRARGRERGREEERRNVGRGREEREELLSRRKQFPSREESRARARERGETKSGGREEEKKEREEGRRGGKVEIEREKRERERERERTRGRERNKSLLVTEISVAREREREIARERRRKRDEGRRKSRREERKKTADERDCGRRGKWRERKKERERERERDRGEREASFLSFFIWE